MPPDRREHAELDDRGPDLVVGPAGPNPLKAVNRRAYPLFTSPPSCERCNHRRTQRTARQFEEKCVEVARFNLLPRSSSATWFRASCPPRCPPLLLHEHEELARSASSAKTRHVGKLGAAVPSRPAGPLHPGSLAASGLNANRSVEAGRPSAPQDRAIRRRSPSLHPVADERPCRELR